MSVSRFVARAARASTRITPVSSFTKPAVVSIARSFSSNNNKLSNADPLVVATEVPISSYEGGKVQRNTIAVTEVEQAHEVAVEEVPEKVVPLTRALYNQMPPHMQKMTLMDKVVVVTGGARGLGNFMARACVEAGAKAIIIFDANQELGDSSAHHLHQLTDNKIPIEFLQVDVRDENAINDAVKAVVDRHGAPDVLINSAGIADSNIPAETYDTVMFRRLIDINLTGSFLVSQAIGKSMIAANKPGSIVLVASMSGSIVNYPQEQSCYNASKAGVIQLGKSLGAEWAKYNIRVNCISPGYMDTALNNVPALDAQKVIWKSLTPQNRLGAVDDLNGLAVFLGSDASAFMTGSNVIIDGGYTLY
ncbi:D-arabinitol 2-dehydrogenase [Hyphodiscus hymeniophilus]|uniref:D-arabinitol 2-dehydrogenase n=1 Tax=Hyphodiscus hymeniophilus TaxID=353542 RepID=A0A9P6SKL4_9HELO|nr:D-arabinitol 2-dehydrogenase [Hyphodiscus hymeniophilus]